MSIEDDLPGLFDELAEAHVVGEPPGSAIEPEPSEPTGRRAAVLLAAAASVLLVVGLVFVGSRTSEPSQNETAGNTAAAPTLPLVAPLVSGLDLVRLEAESAEGGTTRVEVVFDGDLPDRPAELVGNPTEPNAVGVSYTVQSSAGQTVSVCDATHSFPPPENRTVDVFVPLSWFSPDASLDPPIVWDSGGDQSAKIIICESAQEFVQIAIWGAASNRLEDVNVSVLKQSIAIDITPVSTAVPPVRTACPAVDFEFGDAAAATELDVDSGTVTPKVDGIQLADDLFLSRGSSAISQAETGNGELAVTTRDGFGTAVFPAAQGSPGPRVAFRFPAAAAPDDPCSSWSIVGQDPDRPQTDFVALVEGLQLSSVEAEETGSVSSAVAGTDELFSVMEVEAIEVFAGDDLEAVLVVTNLTGAPLEILDDGCGPNFTLALQGGPLQGAAFTWPCRGPFIVPEGETQYPFTLRASLSGCSREEVVSTEPPRCPPVPAGIYEAQFVGSLPGIPIPQSLEITVI